MRGRNSCESALEAEAVIHRVDPVNRELAALVEGVLVTIDVPPACEVILRGERIKLRMVQPRDRVRVTYTEFANSHGRPCDRGATRAPDLFPFAVNPPLPLPPHSPHPRPPRPCPRVLRSFRASPVPCPDFSWRRAPGRFSPSGWPILWRLILLGSRGQPLITRRTVSPRASFNRFRLIFPVKCSFCACPMPGLSAAWGGWHGKCFKEGRPRQQRPGRSAVAPPDMS